MPAPGGLYAIGWAIGNAGLAPPAPPYVFRAFASRNGRDDLTFLLRVTLAEPGRWHITGTVPAGWAAGDQVVVWARLTAAGQTTTYLLDQFEVRAA